MEIAVRNGVTDLGTSPRVLPKDLGFGRIFADRMFRMQYTEGRGWQDAEIVPYGPILLDPAAKVLHYGQEIFEGHKAYAWADGRIALFRPEANASRLNESARRMRMPEIPEAVQLSATFELVHQVRDWVPRDPDCSLYIRPCMIATQAGLGVRPATEYMYYIITSPVGSYFPNGFGPIRVMAEAHYVRAAFGGTGAAKTGGNYGGSLLGQAEAKEKGYDGVLWLDAKEHRYVEEIGAMNIFFVIDGGLVTSPLAGSILSGVTRDSILRLAEDMGYTALERRISMDEVVERIENGTLTEAFGAGTAAVITPVGTIGWQGRDLLLQGGEVGPLTGLFYKALTDIQYGRVPDAYGWMRPLP